MASTSAVELLFGSYRRQVLGLLLLKPDLSLHVREIARLSNVPAGSLHRELRMLTEAELLLREPAGNQVKYRANRDHPIFAQLAEIFRKTSGMADVLREALAPLSTEIDFAFVFGSVARGKEGATSDVDVCVIGKTTFPAIVKALAPAQTRLGREINPVVSAKKDFQAKLRERDRFTIRVVKEPKLFILGTADDFAKFAPHRPA
jgi:predicted nucleotidyltransferase